MTELEQAECDLLHAISALRVIEAKIVNDNRERRTAYVNLLGCQRTYLAVLERVLEKGLRSQKGE